VVKPVTALQLVVPGARKMQRDRTATLLASSEYRDRVRLLILEHVVKLLAASQHCSSAELEARETGT
jgi:hypothetical protein